jgi:hypothetical protein
LQLILSTIRTFLLTSNLLTCSFTLPAPGRYYVSSYFAEISGTDPVINVNRPNLRVFYIHYNLNPADSQGPIDPFADAGNQKFTANPVVSRVGLLQTPFFEG